MKNMCRLLLFHVFCLSALAGAQTGATLVVTTDMRCNWSLDGRPMGLLMTDDSKVVPVSPGEHLIEAATTDELGTSRTKVEVDQGQEAVGIQLKSQHDAAVYPIWTDPATNLMWTKKDNGSDVNWNQANAYCSNLHLAGYGGWRLPTIQELQGIYDPSVSSQKLFNDGAKYNVHVKGNLNLTGWLWSSSRGDASGKPSQQARLLNFGQEGQAQSFPLGFSFSSRALCVRRSSE